MQTKKYDESVTVWKAEVRTQYRQHAKQERNSKTGRLQHFSSEMQRDFRGSDLGFPRPGELAHSLCGERQRADMEPLLMMRPAACGIKCFPSKFGIFVLQ